MYNLYFLSTCLKNCIYVCIFSGQFKSEKSYLSFVVLVNKTVIDTEDCEVDKQTDKFLTFCFTVSSISL